MKQPVANVSADDIQRIIKRDFSPEEWVNVSDALKSYDSESEKGTNRVHAAILKLANGNADLVKKQVDRAKNDYRDVIIWAEYPRDAEWGFRDRPLDVTEKIYKDDWEEYEAWLYRE